ncbi:MAG: glycoside hydrolase family 65 protein [Acidiferrobacterales bacterium]
MVEKQFYPSLCAATETVFATANGYLGMRGNFEEGPPVSHSGTYVNGFYESWPIIYGEEAYGFAKTGQTIVSVPDSKLMKLYVDDEPLHLPTAALLSFERVLDMRAGTLDRDILWETPSAKQVSIKSRRLVSLEYRHVAAISYEVTVRDADASVVISSEIANEHDAQGNGADPRKARGFVHKPLIPRAHYANGQRVLLSYATQNSKMTLACGVDHTVETDCPFTTSAECSEDAGRVVFSFEAGAGVPVRVIKYVTYHTSREAPPAELRARAERTLDRAVEHGFEELVTAQGAYLDDFWRSSDVKLDIDPAVQQATRFNLFQICQATARAEDVGIPAKGLTGHGYEGHYFWDTEIYLFPFLVYTAPRIAKNLLSFRYSMLEKARKRAREVNQHGALFPWRTINGEEASAYYAAGTAQYHINADIIYALKKYIEITGDEQFLRQCGAEMLVETARLWVDLGFYSERRSGKFCIHGVTGPDEYTTVVNNNTYTNLMARENLWYAAKTITSLQSEDPNSFAALVEKTGLELAEVEAWRKAADNMYVPYDERPGIHLQDDSFLDREVWDFQGTPDNRYPLLLNYHPLVIYRHQVIKQADVVLAMVLLGNEFSIEQKKRNFDYYDALTTGDSSLSASIQSIAAFELDYVEKARKYAVYAALMDLANFGGNVQDGCHIASMGGTWMAIVYGLAGMRDYDGHLSFRPTLPNRVKGYRFPLTVRDQRLEVDVDRKSALVTYLLSEGSELVISHRDEQLTLTVGVPVSRPIESKLN